MSTLSVSLQGRFGNQTMQWLFAYAFAQKHGMDFVCEEWIGEKVFSLPEYKRPWAGAATRRVNEMTIFEQCLDLSKPPYDDREFRGYAQMQQCMIYTKRQAQQWLKLRPEVEEACRVNMRANNLGGPIQAHIRRGDYAGYGYPLVHLGAYIEACAEFGLDSRRIEVLSDGYPKKIEYTGLPDEISFMPDFYCMMQAKTLLRANSSFSWLASLLGDGLTLSPVVEGLEGGKEHECRFVAGNWPRFTNLDFVQDLHVNP